MLYITTLYLIYVIHNSLYLLIPYPYFAPAAHFYPLVSVSLLSISVNQFLFCYINSFLFFRFQNFTPFYEWIVFHYRDMSHFIYRFICGWTFGCFHLLAIMNDTAMNMGRYPSIWVPAFKSLGYLPRSEIAGSYGKSMFNLWETSILSPKVAVPFYWYIPTSNTQGFQLLHLACLTFITKNVLNF